MRLIPDTIAGRTIAALLAGVVFFHLASMWAWTHFAGSEPMAEPMDHGTSMSGMIVSTSLMAAGVLAVLIAVVRTITKPLQACAAAVQRLYREAEPAPLAVQGPREVRELAAAFNEMEQRVKRLVDDRTLTLAAISHDLKSPLARARLRAENIGDPELRRQFEADFGEMLSMIDSALDFLKGERAAEPVREIDLSAILQSICDELTDSGCKASLAVEGRTVLRGRRLALKRAFFNLASNAVKYGGEASLSASGGPKAIRVTIADSGPGVPPDQREAVFRPFFRLEGSRNRETGGVGLGLTVARTVIRSHGGEVEMRDRPGGGLEVHVIIPI
jgi:two-component system, OmpR family, sensor kinase